jgi:L-amino acid N-acyltransferase YncA
MQILPLIPEHYPQVDAIYLEGIATGNATFQTEGKSWEEWDSGHLQHSRFVAIEHGKVLGWAALSPVSSRCVYAGVAEVSVYVAGIARGKSVGLALMQRLVQESEAAGIWTLQAGIFPENEASVRLHQKCGFRIVGTRERIGKMHTTGQWRDNLLLERRSRITGL